LTSENPSRSARSTCASGLSGTYNVAAAGVVETGAHCRGPWRHTCSGCHGGKSTLFGSGLRLRTQGSAAQALSRPEP
jgi:hypothetical protein